MSVMPELEQSYSVFYRSRDPHWVYPVEFVVRAFLGQYPRLARFAAGGRGEHVLDLGFGDGRNMPLLSNLGMQVHGVEITEEICARTVKRLEALGVAIETRVGRNSAIPYGDAFFHHVLACHSCYYVDRGTRFEDNLREIARVLRPNGRFVFSAPIGTSYIMRGARDLGDGHMEITNDPYGVRNGAVLKKFDDEADLTRSLSPFFDELSIGSCRNDFWGIEEHVWVVVAHRSDADPSLEGTR
jgi:SAM-dependent methyltransferase